MSLKLMQVPLFRIKNLQDISIKAGLIILLLFQYLFWNRTEDIRPNLGIVPNVPNQLAVRALSFGDSEFYFRSRAFRIQNSGDTFGRFSPLKNYDYKKLYRWFTVLDSINSKSNFLPSLAAYYYSQTQNPKDTIYIIKYLEEHADKNPSEKWWWYYQAMYIANHVYEDKDLALKLAHKLKDSSGPDAPIWTKQMVAIVHKKWGENCEALAIISDILEDYEQEEGDKKIEDKDLNFMKYFIQQRIRNLEEENFDYTKCFEKQE